MIGGAGSDLSQAGAAGLQQGILEEQVGAGIAGDGKLGENHQIGALFVGLGDLLADIHNIRRNVAHTHRIDGTGDANKVKHGNTSINIVKTIIPHFAVFAKKISL